MRRKRKKEKQKEILDTMKKNRLMKKEKQLFWDAKAPDWNRKIEPLFRKRIKACIRENAGRKHLSLGAGTLCYQDSHTVLDISPKMLKKNKARKKVVADLEKRLPFAAGSFDSIDAVFVANYIEDASQLVHEVKRILRKKGIFIIVNSLRSVKDLSSLMEKVAGNKNRIRMHRLLEKNRLHEVEYNEIQLHGKAIWMAVYQKR